MIRKFLREYFLLPPGEQRAILLLSLLVICTLGLRLVIGSIPGREAPGYAQFQEEAMAIMAQLKELDSLEQLERASVKFYRGTKAPSDPQYPICLNKTDSVALLALPGIGPVFAGRIIKYRSLLGGYYTLNQLLEVYGMKPETLERIRPLLIIDSASWNMISLNKCEFRDLLRHPYLEYADVLSLVRYMDRKGAVDSMEEVLSNVLLADSVAERIEPYLDFSPIQ